MAEDGRPAEAASARPELSQSAATAGDSSSDASTVSDASGEGDHPTEASVGGHAVPTRPDPSRVPRGARPEAFPGPGERAAVEASRVSSAPVSGERHPRRPEPGSAPSPGDAIDRAALAQITRSLAEVEQRVARANATLARLRLLLEDPALDEARRLQIRGDLERLQRELREAEAAAEMQERAVEALRFRSGDSVP